MADDEKKVADAAGENEIGSPKKTQITGFNFAKIILFLMSLIVFAVVSFLGYELIKKVYITNNTPVNIVTTPVVKPTLQNQSVKKAKTTSDIDVLGKVHFDKKKRFIFNEEDDLNGFFSDEYGSFISVSILLDKKLAKKGKMSVRLTVEDDIGKKRTGLFVSRIPVFNKSISDRIIFYGNWDNKNSSYINVRNVNSVTVRPVNPLN